jgi:amidase
MDVQTDNTVYGRTNHPRFHDRTCGGSSGGGAAAVALGISDLDIGNDVMGSIRIPAGFCGNFGFVPTGGAVYLGEIAGGEPMGSTFAQILRIGLQSAEPENIRYVLPSLLNKGCPSASDIRGDRLKIAWSADCGGLPVSRDTRACMESFKKKLSASHEVVALKPEDYDFEAARGAFIKLLYGAIAATLPPATVFAAKHLMHNKNMNNSLKDFLAAENVREACKRQLDTLFRRFDCLIVPVTATPAFHHLKPDKILGNQPVYSTFEVDGEKVNYATANLGFTTPFMTANPVMALPIGTTGEGLPVGVQVVCGQYCESKLLDIADILCNVINITIPKQF